MEFAGRTALVTGAARGIGQAFAAVLAEAGSRVLLVDIMADRVEAAAAALRAAGHDATAFVCDLSDDAAVAALGDNVTMRFGTPDIVHNNAYVGIVGGIDDIDLDDWRRSIDVNLFGYVRIIKAFATGMIARRSGLFINTVSPMGIVPDLAPGAFMLPYMSGKAAGVGLSQGMALALAPHGVDVRIFFPEFTRSEAAANVPGKAPPEFKASLEHAMAQAFTPESSAAALMAGLRGGQFLISHEPTFPERLVRAAGNGLDPRIETRI